MFSIVLLTNLIASAMLVARKLLLVYSEGRYCVVQKFKIVTGSEHFQGKWNRGHGWQSHHPT